MFYVFHGDDSHSQKETLADLISKLGDQEMLDLNTTRFEGRGLTFPELQHACDSVPFLADKRLVIVEDLLRSKPAFLDELLDYLPNIPESTRLFFLESKALPGRNRVLKLAEKEEKGFVKAFHRPEGGQVDRWIIRRTKEVGGKMAPRAAHLLAENVGNDLQLLDQEIEKLVMYRAGEEIVAEDVTLLCPYVAEASIFDLVDALGNRDGHMAATRLQQKLADGSDPFFLFSMFARQFRLLIQVKELAEAGMTPQEISRQLKLHSYVTGKIYQQAQNFTLEQMEQIYGHLLEVDVEVKTGQNDMVTALSLFVAGLAH